MTEVSESRDVRKAIDRIEGGLRSILIGGALIFIASEFEEDDNTRERSDFPSITESIDDFVGRNVHGPLEIAGMTLGIVGLGVTALGTVERFD